MTTVDGQYDRSRISANMFSLVLAPPSNGKGAINYAERLIKKVHKLIIDQSTREIAAYEAELIERKKNEQTTDDLIQPKLKVPIIPGNISLAKLTEHMEINGGAGVIIESEADTLGNSLKNQWGGFDSLLRAAP